MKSPLLLLLALFAAVSAQLNWDQDVGRIIDFGDGDGGLSQSSELGDPHLAELDDPHAQPTSPLTVFFEQDHYTNKASEEGFCEYHCGSERRPVVIKPGRCPAEQPRPGLGCAGFTDRCKYDSECPGAQRCCFDGCARVCVDPDVRKRCEDISCPPDAACIDNPPADAQCVPTAPRPGRCPAQQARPGRSCAGYQDQCTYDAQCPGTQRCCSDGCAKVCVDPDLRKRCEDISCPPDSACVEYPPADAHCVTTEKRPGRCPADQPNPGRVCQPKDTCKYDSECSGGDKCCKTSCGHVCLKPRKPGCDETKCKVGYKCEEDRYGNPECQPIPCEQDGAVVDIECNSCTCIQGFLLCSQEECPPTKPGFCPKIVRGYMGICVEECSTDYDCGSDTKCCSTGCGHTCQAPIPEIVHPCKTVRFRCGKQTRCAATRALCRPGQTCPLVPLCVSNTAPYCASCPDGKVCVLQKKYCAGGGACHRQPICIQLYSDDTIFQENELLEAQVVAEQQQTTTMGRAAENSVFY